MSLEVDYYTVEAMIRDARPEIRGEIDRAVRDAVAELRDEIGVLREELRAAVAVLHSRTDHLA